MAVMSTGTRLALFDFDGTLCAGNTLHLLIRHLLSGRASASRIASWALARKLRFVSSRRFKNGILAALPSGDREALRRLGEELYVQRVRPLLRSRGLAELERRRREGYRVIVVTGAFDFLIGPFCREHELAECLCCAVARDEPSGTWRIDGAEMRGEDKVAAVLGYLGTEPVDWPGSTAYTDDVRDLPLVRMTGQRYLVVDGPGRGEDVQFVDWGGRS